MAAKAKDVSKSHELSHFTPKKSDGSKWQAFLECFIPAA